MQANAGIKKSVRRVLDPVVAASLAMPALVMRRVRHSGLSQWPITQKTLLGLGVYPLLDHYYDPQIRPNGLTPEALQQDRYLPGLDLRTDSQRSLLSQFRFQHELKSLPHCKPAMSDGVYWFNNTYFGRIDGSIWYSMLRTFKPKKVVEVGSGFSTLIARCALKRNAAEGGASAAHVCIEPYENPWLERCGAQIVREKVEHADSSIVADLRENDVLFIDSSHMLRPNGDVVVEILQLLPRLAPGVIVHVHDIFTPKDYPWEWLFQENRLWNEQYMLEAFLSMNPSFEIMLSAYHMLHVVPEELEAACIPLQGQNFDSTICSSFFIRRIG